MNDLIKVVQLPVIEERLRSMAADIDRQVEDAISLVVTSDTVITVKAVRADMRKQFDRLEAERKMVKEAVFAPYNAFEGVYKECVSDKFRAVDATLKERIDNVEGELKQRKTAEVQEYFDEYHTYLALPADIITWERVGIKVGLSDSMKSLKAKAKDFLDRVSGEFEMLNNMPDKDELLVEYHKTLNVTQAVNTVKARHDAIERQRAQAAAEESRRAAAAQVEAEGVARVNDVLRAPVIAAPEPVEDDPVIEVAFRVRGTKSKILALKQYLIAEGYDFT